MLINKIKTMKYLKLETILPALVVGFIAVTLIYFLINLDLEILNRAF